MVMPEIIPTLLSRKAYQHCIDTENSFFHMNILEPVHSVKVYSYEQVINNDPYLLGETIEGEIVDCFVDELHALMETYQGE